MRGKPCKSCLRVPFAPPQNLRGPTARVHQIAELGEGVPTCPIGAGLGNDDEIIPIYNARNPHPSTQRRFVGQKCPLVFQESAASHRCQPCVPSGVVARLERVTCNDVEFIFARRLPLWRGQGGRLKSSRISTSSRSPLLCRYPEFHPLRKLTQRGLQRVSNLPQPPHRRVDDPSLDPADVCSIEAVLAAKTLLRLACPLTEFRALPPRWLSSSDRPVGSASCAVASADPMVLR